MVGGGKGGMQESLHQFMGRFMSIVESLPGPSMTVQLVTSSPTIAGHTHTGFQIWDNYPYLPYSMAGLGTVASINLKKDKHKM